MVMPNLIPYKNKWLISYETLLFDTLDGDLDVNQYALDGNNTGYYIRTVPKDQDQFIHIGLDLREDSISGTGALHSLASLNLVRLVPRQHAYYDEFLTAAGQIALAASPMTPLGLLPPRGIIRVKSSAAAYNPLRTIPKAPQPSRIEQVSVLPPAIPTKSSLGDYSVTGHQSIGFDATSNSGEKASISSYSWGHTCGAGANLLVFGDSHVTTGGNDYHVTGVTYNGAALTSVRSDVTTYINSYYYRSTIYYLLAPATGSSLTVSVSLGGTVFRAFGGVVSYSGAKQSGQPDANNGAASAAGGTPTVNVTTVVDNCWVFAVAIINGYFGSSDNYSRWLVAGQFGYGGADTNGPVHPAGTQTMSWSGCNGGYWAISAASFSVAPPTTFAIARTEGLTTNDTRSLTNTIGLTFSEGMHSGETLGELTKLARSEWLTAGDALSQLLLAAISKVEGLTEGEDSVLKSILSRAEGLTLADSLSLLAKSYLDKAEGLTTGEVSTLKTILLKSEGIAANDVLALLMAAAVTRGEELTESDSITLKSILSKFEGLTAGEALVLKTILLRAEGLTAGESLSSLMTAILNRAENLTASDLSTLKTILSISEGSKLVDSTLLAFILTLAISEGLSLKDIPSVVFAYLELSGTSLIQGKSGKSSTPGTSGSSSLSNLTGKSTRL